MYFIFILLLLVAANSVKVPSGGLYTRIEPHGVLESIERYLEDNELHNCFARRIDFRLLALKCWGENEGLMDVRIETIPTKNYQVAYI